MTNPSVWGICAAGLLASFVGCGTAETSRDASGDAASGGSVGASGNAGSGATGTAGIGGAAGTGGAPGCGPGDRKCEGNVPQTCDAGRWVDGAPCQYACVAGACVGVCYPDTLRCSSGHPEICDSHGEWASQPPCPTELADVNGDGTANNFDISPFVYAVTHTQTEFEGAYPTGHYFCADCNEDGTVNNFDISPFVYEITH